MKLTIKTGLHTTYIFELSPEEAEDLIVKLGDQICEGERTNNLINTKLENGQGTLNINVRDRCRENPE